MSTNLKRALVKILTRIRPLGVLVLYYFSRR